MYVNANLFLVLFMVGVILTGYVIGRFEQSVEDERKLKLEKNKSYRIGILEGQKQMALVFDIIAKTEQEEA